MPLNEPKSLALPFAISSILFLGVLAISPVKDYLSEWRVYQNEFNQRINDLPVRVKPVKVGIRQIWIKERGITDRCMTCHLGLLDERLASLEQPFTPHPVMYHEPEIFGCTPCHRGQGIATTVVESVGHVEFWNEPMLPAEFIEAGCGTCHEETAVPDAPVLTRGRQLLEQYRCVQCHVIPGVAKGYDIPLDGLKRKVNREWLVRWLKSPRETVGNSLMPSFRFTEEQINDLTDFLLTATKLTGTDSWEPLPNILKEDYLDDDSLIQQGLRRFREARCISCHPIEGRGGRLAVDLGLISSKISPAWLYNYIRNPQHLAPGVPMPRYGFTQEDAVAVTAYILSEFINWDLEEPSGESYTPSPDYFQRGLKVFNDFNCLGCHSLSTKGVAKNMGPALTGIGDKPLVELEFGRAEIVETRWSFIYHKLDSPHQFLDNSRMPDFGFDNREILAVTTALLALQDDVEQTIITPPIKTSSLPLPQGDVGRLVDRYACLTCHLIGDAGYLLATDLSREGSRVHSQWLRDYFNLVFVDDELAQVEVPLGDEATIEIGRQLLHEYYGCQACHQVNGKGGYVGPPLGLTQERSKPEWIYAWIKNPQRYRPDTIDPNQGISDEDAKALTAYIMSLGVETP